MKTQLTRRNHIRTKPKINRILVPVDFSTESSHALDYAVDLAGNMRAKIILLHVIEPVYAGGDGLALVSQPFAPESSADKKRLGLIAAKFIPKGVFDKAIVRMGVPYHEITTAAKILRAGLIVLTTHGRTGLSHILMGSTAERVVRHAHCPVLTVRRTR